MLKMRRPFNWRARSFTIALGERTLIMGIINATPDSFSGDGVLSKYKNEKVPGLSYALKLHDLGADILDIGGESTRPGAKCVAVQDELRRVIPLVSALAKRVKIPISVDTYKPVVAQQALDAGASIINTIKGTPPQIALLKTVKRYNAGLILMHMRGTPRNMQSLTTYKDVVHGILNELSHALKICEDCGVNNQNIVIDPGIGFSKTAEQNLSLLKNLNLFARLHLPILVGTSRKSFIGKVLNNDSTNRLAGTIASAVMAASCGAHIVRVHDVKEMKQALSVTDAIMKAS